MQLYDRGLKRRLPTMLGGDPRRIRMAYSLMFSLPGTPTLYYGEEIGMGEDLEADGRMAVRTPMQWSASRNGGFSTAPPSRLVQRVVPGACATGPEGTATCSESAATRASARRALRCASSATTSATSATAHAAPSPTCSAVTAPSLQAPRGLRGWRGHPRRAPAASGTRSPPARRGSSPHP